ncbi:hypothetical protein DLAC_05867 [Tieghemostelium lacteum]|uniref:Uncharacterized protein n=1 Tax=Tieghemostelium lacteum TaxID=361077 RepID=A0A151ZH20_TIELA|nr:hypothetical protein DLAC_05867 [Tieghemostelium lacteum]|eukprot:KYQ93225.1 hypothetical protein DLAC_05867 [Tieghemostelium lacteum]
MKEDIAKFLLSKGYYLTALEFYQELLEDDGTELESLKQYFSNQAPTDRLDNNNQIFNHKSSTPTTTNNNNNNSAEKQRISSLEQELKHAKEEINKLRSQQITSNNGQQQVKSPTVSNSNTSDSISSSISQEDKETLKQLSKEKIKSHELKILNYLTKQYLIKNNYSLTAVSLSEETEEDYRQWSDLKINGVEPPSILTMYRYFFENGDAGIQGAISKAMGEISKLKKDLLDTESNWRESKKKLQLLQKEKDDLSDKNKEYEQRFEDISKRFKSGQNDITSSTSNLLSSPILKSQDTSKNSNTTSNQHSTTTTTTTTVKSEINQDNLSVMRKTFRSLIEKRRQTVAFRIVSNNIDDESEISLRVAEEVDRIRTLESDNQSIVKIVADSLPHIAKGVLINKREELIPLILIVIYNHPDENVRFSLTKFLFNLNKKPNEVQRHVIMRGCMQLASIIGPARTETEILSQCWEMLTEKHPEKRVLVADSCGCLAQFVNAELRLSLILSILQRLGEDKSKLVKEAVAKNFSLLINFFESSDKYQQVEESFKKLLYDQDVEVQVAARSYFLPSLANWADLLESLNSRLANMLLTELYNILSKYMSQKDEVKIQESDIIKTDQLLLCLSDIIPRIYQSIVASSPFVTEKDAKSIETEYNKQEALYQFQLTNYSSTNNINSSQSIMNINNENINNNNNSSNSSDNNENRNSTNIVTNSSIRIAILGDQEIQKLTVAFEQYIQSMVTNDVPQSWNSLEWIANDFLSKLIKIISCIPLYNNILIIQLSKTINKFCLTFGQTFTKKIVKNAFLRELQKDPKSEETKKYRVLSVFTAGVLTTLPSSELLNFLKDIIVLISMEEKGWVHQNILSLVKCLELLCNNVFDRKKEVCEAISDLTANPANPVRTCILNLLRVTIPLFKPDQISGSVVPSLVMMSTDPDRSVRYVCLGSAAVAISNLQDQVSIDRLAISIEKILEDKNHNLEVEFVKSMTKIIPTVQNRFRESFILPKILDFARKNNHNPSNENRSEMSQILFDSARAYLALSTSSSAAMNSANAIQLLKLILNDAELHDNTFKTMVQTMLADLEHHNSAGVASTSSTPPKKVNSSTSTGNLLNKIEPPNLSNLNFKNWGWKNTNNK